MKPTTYNQQPTWLKFFHFTSLAFIEDNLLHNIEDLQSLRNELVNNLSGTTTIADVDLLLTNF